MPLSQVGLMMYRSNSTHRPRGAAWRAGMLGAAVLLSGCYKYTDLDPGGVMTAGMHVRVELTESGAKSVAASIGPNATSLEGVLTSADSGGVTVALESVYRRSEGMSEWHGETVAVTRDAIRNLTERKPARFKTAVAASAFAAAGAALVVFIAKATGLVSGNGGRPPIQGT